MEKTDPKSFKNWLPLKLIEKGNKLLLEWVYMGKNEFNKPFFDETLSEFKQQNSTPPNLVSTRLTPLKFLIDVAHSIEKVPPNLFIFHTSRCGSTLATQLLSLTKKNIVVPEYPMIDALFRINEKQKVVSDSIREKLIKSIIAVVGQKRTEEQQRLIIKLDSWHFIFYNEIQKLFTKANSAILYRDPDSILKSNSRIPGMQFISELVSPYLFRLKNNFDGGYCPFKYQNSVLKSMYGFIDEIMRQNNDVILLNYADGMDKNMVKILQTLEMPSNFKNKLEFKNRLNYHSKNPSKIFNKEEIAINELTINTTREAFQKINILNQQL